MTNSLLIFSTLVIASAGYPLWQTWNRLATTSLRHTIIWMSTAWLFWLGTNVLQLWFSTVPLQYLAGVISACTFIAVLGARKPGMTAWNFVAVGLLFVLALPLIEQSWTSPDWTLATPYSIFLYIILAVGIINYCFTSAGFIYLVAGLAFAIQIWTFTDVDFRSTYHIYISTGVPIILSAVLWFKHYYPARSATATTAQDRFSLTWLTFRDRYGLVWSLRIQEQFNHAAKNTQLPFQLDWYGLVTHSDKPLDEELLQKATDLLGAVLQRFGISQRNRMNA